MEFGKPDRPANQERNEGQSQGVRHHTVAEIVWLAIVALELLKVFGGRLAVGVRLLKPAIATDVDDPVFRVRYRTLRHGLIPYRLRTCITR